MVGRAGATQLPILIAVLITTAKSGPFLSTLNTNYS